MIDLHCHVLPGIDDGPPSLEDSVELARAAQDTGVRSIVATPHVSWRYINDAPVIAREVDSVRDAIRTAGVEIEIHPGAEIATARLDDLTDDELCALRLGAGSWLLIESPLTRTGEDLESIVEQTQRRGHGVVLAHPERSPLFLSEPQRLETLMATGVLCSITASSLVGAFGRDVRRFALQLVREGMVHNISSDAHDVSRRPPILRGHIQAAVREVPELLTRAEWMTTEVPRAILAGEAVPKAPAAHVRRRRGRR